MLISFHLASKFPDKMGRLLDNLEQTVTDPRNIEVLVKIDQEDEAMHRFMADESGRRPLTLRYISRPRLDGYFSLWIGYNELIKLCSPKAYFVSLINDEVHFKTKHWDEVLRKYIGFFPDDIFRLRISQFKLRNYYDFWECGYAPDAYAIYTKKWFDVSGDWNACNTPDAFQQFVVYYLGRATLGWPSNKQYSRDVPIWDIDLGSELPYQGLSDDELKERVRKAEDDWFRLVSYEIQTECSHRAHRLLAYIWATENGVRDFVVESDRSTKLVRVVERLSGNVVRRFTYRLNPLAIVLKNLWRKPLYEYYCGGSWEIMGIHWRQWKEKQREAWNDLKFVQHLASLWARIKRQLAFFPDDPIGGIKWIFNHPSKRVRKGKPGASDWVDAHPPSGLVDGWPEPWGSAETRDDTYFYITRDKAFEARRIDIVLFSPRGRSHLKDVSVVAGNKLGDSIDEWVVIPARTRGMRGYAEKVVIPERHDFTRIRIKLDRTSIPDGGFNTYGLACFSSSRGYERNYLAEGRGIYVRQMSIIE